MMVSHICAFFCPLPYHHYGQLCNCYVCAAKYLFLQVFHSFWYLFLQVSYRLENNVVKFLAEDNCSTESDISCQLTSFPNDLSGEHSKTTQEVFIKEFFMSRFLEHERAPFRKSDFDWLSDTDC